VSVVDYAEFLASKRRVVHDEGVAVDDAAIHPSLFPFQRDITRWALRKGRAALFEDTGLGKTRQQIEWARLTGQRALILAPLGVTQQTVREARRIGVETTYAHHQGEAPATGITITNYERLHHFDPASFGAVVLDESSILKAYSGATKKALVRAFRDTPFRLCCTATPAPNDLEELTNHADFLGVMRANEMRSTFFIADSRGEFMRYRLKRHARQAFYRWLSSWAMAVRKPSDLGYEDGAFNLPGLEIVPHYVASDYRPDDRLFVVELRGVQEASAVRRGTLEDRVERVVQLVQREPAESWLLWCGLNDEGRRLARRLPEAVLVEGQDDPDRKAAALLDFAEGRSRILISKVRIAGFGMNFQRCARMAFVGLGYSFESYYQALRRCHRFGQTRQVVAHIVLSEHERPVYDTVLAKERQHEEMSGGLLAEMRDYEREELYAGTSAQDDYEPRRTLSLPQWLRDSA
jgi:Helicase conserved C-terminal domain